MLKHCIQTKRNSRKNSESCVEDGASVASSRPDSSGYVNKAFSTQTDSNSSQTSNDLDKQDVDGLKTNSRKSSVSNVSPAKDERVNIKLESIQEETPDDIKEIKTTIYSMRKSLMTAALIFCLIVCVSFAVGHYFIGYFPESVKLNEGDRKIIAYSTYFCSAVYTRTPNVWLTVLGSLSFGKELKYDRNSKLKIGIGETWKRNFYLTKNSKLNITIQSLDIVDVLIFKGEKNMNIWSERKYTETFLYKHVCCLNIPGRQQESYYFDVENEDNYYLVIHRSKTHGNAAKVNLTLKFTRPTMDLSKTNRQCRSSEIKACSVSLDFASGEKTVIERPLEYKELAIQKAVNVEWNCKARIWFYVVAYSCVYLLIVLVIFIIYKLLNPKCIKSLKSKASRNKRNEIYTVEYSNGRQMLNKTDNDHDHESTARRQSISKSRLSNSVSYESITKYHNQALDDDYDDLMQQGTNGYLDTSCHGKCTNKQPPTGIAAIYREGSGNESRRGSIVKYFAPKRQLDDSFNSIPNDKEENFKTLDESSDEVLLSWPHNSVPTSETKVYHHALLKPTRSTGYFRVLSPMTQCRTGAVAGRRELRSPNPIFYRPSSQMSTTAEETTLEDGTEI